MCDYSADGSEEQVADEEAENELEQQGAINGDTEDRLFERARKQGVLRLHKDQEGVGYIIFYFNKVSSSYNLP